jgi:hypothetical protein
VLEDRAVRDDAVLGKRPRALGDYWFDQRLSAVLRELDRGAGEFNYLINSHHLDFA